MSFKTENIIIVRANLASKEKFEKNSHKLGLKNFVLKNECYIILKGDINTQNLKSLIFKIISLNFQLVEKGGYHLVTI